MVTNERALPRKVGKRLRGRDAMKRYYAPFDVWEDRMHGLHLIAEARGCCCEARLLRDPQATQRAHTAFDAILARHGAKPQSSTRRKTRAS